ncbi:L-asparaginase [Massilia sp. W12]|uniref:L-asparaginase n=1 Tax=Massilia sp. W12 TaxID=3126507 RepID=UPI0030D2EF38
MKAIAPGTVIFHRHRGYGVITAVNLLTGWISARFGSERRTLDLHLGCAQVSHACGEAIRFPQNAPHRMPQARLMEMVCALHAAGYQRLYLYNWPQASGLHWRWHLFAGPRNWMQRPLRPGWYGAGSDYNMNPVLGWGDQPGASATELAQALAAFDPDGLSQALGRDEDHSQWFAAACAKLLPDYAFSFEMDGFQSGDELPPLRITPVRLGVPPYSGATIGWPPGWARLWPHKRAHLMPAPKFALETG